MRIGLRLTTRCGGCRASRMEITKANLDEVSVVLKGAVPGAGGVGSAAPTAALGAWSVLCGDGCCSPPTPLGGQ